MSYIKDPAATLDYGLDWSAWLEGDTIATSTWTIPAGLTTADDSNDTTTTTVWLGGGIAGTTYRVTNQITTAGGRTDERTIRITVSDR